MSRKSERKRGRKVMVEAIRLFSGPDSRGEKVNKDTKFFTVQFEETPDGLKIKGDSNE